MSELLEQPRPERETIEQHWTIRTAKDWPQVVPRIRAILREMLDAEAGAVWQSIVTEFVANAIQHGFGLEDRMDQTGWTFPDEASPVELSLNLKPEIVDVSVTSVGTIVPRSILERFFTIDPPRVVTQAGRSEVVFHCQSKPVSQLPEPTPEELFDESGRGFRMTAINLDQPTDRLEIRVVSPNTGEPMGQWPEGKPVEHTVRISGPRVRPTHEVMTPQSIAA